MIIITDLCAIGKISVGSIEGGLIENKITALMVSLRQQLKLKILVKYKIFFDDRAAGN